MQSVELKQFLLVFVTIGEIPTIRVKILHRNTMIEARTVEIQLTQS